MKAVTPPSVALTHKKSLVSCPVFSSSCAQRLNRRRLDTSTSCGINPAASQTASYWARTASCATTASTVQGPSPEPLESDKTCENTLAPLSDSNCSCPNRQRTSASRSSELHGKSC